MALEGLHHITAIAADATRNGVLIELATRGTGFTVDEPLKSLGEELKLPPQHEPDRARLEGLLTPLANPRSGTAGPLVTAHHRPAVAGASSEDRPSR
jgi:hypothetical protein